MLKTLFDLKIFNFCHDIFGHVRRQFHEETKISFKSYNIADWETNKYTYCPVSQKVKATRQEIWPVNRI